MNNFIDIRFFIEDEATTSRALIDFNNIDYVDSATITNFSGMSGGTYQVIVLKEPVAPFRGFLLKELIVQYDEYEEVKKRYIEIAKNKIGVTNAQ